MSNVDTRQVNRDSLFLLAQLRVDGQDTLHRVKVRNLSSGGMMAEGEVSVVRGTRVSVDLRNVGWVDGTVAWRQDQRFGIAFTNEIDPKLVRSPAADGSNYESPRFVRSPAGVQPVTDPSKLRKI